MTEKNSGRGRHGAGHGSRRTGASSQRSGERGPAPVRVQPARQIAFEVLRAVVEDDAYANLVLPAKLREAQLAPADAALATELTYGTLRRQGTYDAVIAIAA